jgi:hypothetical protein
MDSAEHLGETNQRPPGRRWLTQWRPDCQQPLLFVFDSLK